MMQTLESPPSGSPLPTAALNADRGETLSSTEPEVLAGIYQDNTNMVIWQRELSGKLRDSAEAVLAMRHGCEIAMRVSPQNAATPPSEPSTSTVDTVFAFADVRAVPIDPSADQAPTRLHWGRR